MAGQCKIVLLILTFLFVRPILSGYKSDVAIVKDATGTPSRYLSRRFDVDPVAGKDEEEEVDVLFVTQADYFQENARFLRLLGLRSDSSQKQANKVNKKHIRPTINHQEIEKKTKIVDISVRTKSIDSKIQSIEPIEFSQFPADILTFISDVKHTETYYTMCVSLDCYSIGFGENRSKNKIARLIFKIVKTIEKFMILNVGLECERTGFEVGYMCVSLDCDSIGFGENRSKNKIARLIFKIVKTIKKFIRLNVGLECDSTGFKVGNVCVKLDCDNIDFDDNVRSSKIISWIIKKIIKNIKYIILNVNLECDSNCFEISNMCVKLDCDSIGFVKDGRYYFNLKKLMFKKMIKNEKNDILDNILNLIKRNKDKLMNKKTMKYKNIFNLNNFDITQNKNLFQEKNIRDKNNFLYEILLQLKIENIRIFTNQMKTEIFHFSNIKKSYCLLRYINCTVENNKKNMTKLLFEFFSRDEKLYNISNDLNKTKKQIKKRSTEINQQENNTTKKNPSENKVIKLYNTLNKRNVIKRNDNNQEYWANTSISKKYKYLTKNSLQGDDELKNTTKEKIPLVFSKIFPTITANTDENLNLKNNIASGQEKKYTINTRDEYIRNVTQVLKNSTVIANQIKINNISRKSYTNIPELIFDKIHKNYEVKVLKMGIEKGIFIFEYISNFFKCFLPEEVSIALLRDVIWGRVSIANLIVQSARVEGIFIAAISITFFVALGLPATIIALKCCRALESKRRHRLRSDPDLQEVIAAPGDRWADANDERHGCGSGENCRRRCAVFVTQILLLFISFTVIVLIISNQQLSSSIQKSPAIINTVFTDVNTFVRNSHMQITYTITSSVDTAVDAALSDLEDIQDLLGKPIQHELARETGIDVALEALNDVNTASQDVSVKVSALLEECQAALDTARMGGIRLRELKKLVEDAVTSCIDKDKPLCGTLDTQGLEIAFSVNTILSDYNLAHIRFVVENNLTTAANKAKKEFQTIPQVITRDTFASIKDISNAFSGHRNDIYDSLRELDNMVRNTAITIDENKSIILDILEKILELENWRWFLALASVLTILSIWLLIITGIISGSCGLETKAGPTFLTAIFCICLFTIFLWIITLVNFIIGGHGQMFICAPLYDEPEYKMLSKYFDNPALVYKKGGYFSNLVKGNESLDVPIKDALRKCKNNETLYRTFHLNKIYDVDSLTHQKSWTKIESNFNQIKLNTSNLYNLTPNLQKHLQELLQSTNVNFSLYRYQLSTPITVKDLNSFSVQLKNVADKITDLTTASKIENLSNRTKKLVENIMQPLEKYKQNIIFLLTALEVQILPLQKQINQSIAHLKTIQFYINNQGSVIAENKVKDFTSRLTNYLNQLRNFVLDEITNNIAHCRPIWEIFNTSRFYICKHLIDPINGFWVAMLCCLILFLIVVPILLSLAKYYHDISQRLANTATTLQNSETLILAENTWTTPRSGNQDGW